MRKHACVVAVVVTLMAGPAVAAPSAGELESPRLSAVVYGWVVDALAKLGMSIQPGGDASPAMAGTTPQSPAREVGFVAKLGHSCEPGGG